MINKINDEILLLYGKLMYDFTSLEVILNRIIFHLRYKQIFVNPNVNNLQFMIDKKWKDFKKMKKRFSLGSLKYYWDIVKDFLGDNFQSYTNLVNRISSVAPFRNKLSHQFSEISAYDKWDNNQNTKLEAKMHDFISQYDSIKKDVENIINDSLEILHKFEERYEGQGIKFNYYGSKNTYKSLNGQIRNKNN